MTAATQSTPRTARTRALREDLLDDLRQAAPMPATPPTPELSVPVVPRPAGSVRRPAPRPAPVDTGTPAVELRVTPQRWWGLRLRTLGETPGVVIGAGPVQLSVTGFRR